MEQNSLLLKFLKFFPYVTWFDSMLKELRNCNMYVYVYIYIYIYMYICIYVYICVYEEHKFCIFSQLNLSLVLTSFLNLTTMCFNFDVNSANKILQRTNQLIPLKTQFKSRRSHSTSRSTSTDVPAAKQTENNKNQALQNEIEILQKQIESMKKDYSVVSQIPTR